MKLNTSNKDSGFTIVELLIVIVVIGILAAITLVAFGGVRDRANTSSAQSAANEVLKKAEIHKSLRGSYPTATTHATTGFSSYPESRLEGGVSLASAIGGLTAADATKVVLFATCATGFVVGYYNATESAPRFIAGGGNTQVTASTSAVPSGCTIVS